MAELAKNTHKKTVSEKQSGNLKPGERTIWFVMWLKLSEPQEDVVIESFQCPPNTYPMPRLPGGLLARCTASLHLVPLCTSLSPGETAGSLPPVSTAEIT